MAIDPSFIRIMTENKKTSGRKYKSIKEMKVNFYNIDTGKNVLPQTWLGEEL